MLPWNVLVISLVSCIGDLSSFKALRAVWDTFRMGLHIVTGVRRPRSTMGVVTSTPGAPSFHEVWVLRKC